MPSSTTHPQVTIIMGSKSDWDCLKLASAVLDDFKISHECKVLSAHRSPKQLVAYIESLEKKGTAVIIAGAGGAAHLPGVIAAHTILPVLGVPMNTKGLGGLDSLLSIVQMPGGIPVGTLAIGDAGAKNAALLAIAILAINEPNLKKKLIAFRKHQDEKASAVTLQ